MLRPSSPEQRAIYAALIDGLEQAEIARMRALARLVSDETIERHMELLEQLGQITRTPVPVEPAAPSPVPVEH